jgi:hypothetical protein
MLYACVKDPMWQEILKNFVKFWELNRPQVTPSIRLARPSHPAIAQPRGHIDASWAVIAPPHSARPRCHSTSRKNVRRHRGSLGAGENEISSQCGFIEFNCDVGFRHDETLFFSFFINALPTHKKKLTWHRNKWEWNSVETMTTYRNYLTQ